MTKRDGQLAQQPKPAGGLIVNISSVGGLQYLFSVAYGVGKAAVDRMSKGNSVQFQRAQISFFSFHFGS